MRKIFLLLVTLSFALFAPSQISKTVHVTAGGLSAALTPAELITVTNLTVTGTIDARDFVILRDKAPALKVLILSGTRITAYSGKGTGFASFSSYYENTIPEYAFNGCARLTSISIPSSVTSIDNWAFEGCEGLTYIDIPSSVTTLGGGAFEDCTGLTSIIIPSTVNTIIDELFQGCSGLTSIIIPSSVTSIGRHAFWNCSGLTSIILPTSVTSIEDSAFEFCTGLTSITLSPQLTAIGYYAFLGCAGLTSITLPSLITSIGGSAFYNCIGLNSITIPSSVTSIGGNAFYGCTGLTSIYYNATSCTSIGDGGVFNGCKALTAVTIGNNVKNIPFGAFVYCPKLTSLIIPSSVTSISGDAFADCTGLTSITIPSSVNYIAYEAFYNCTGLTSIYENSIFPPDLNYSANVFFGVDKTTTNLYVPSGSKSAYQAAGQWKDFTNIVEMTTALPTALPTVTNADITIYPNPITDSFQMRGYDGSVLMVIMDLNGKALLKKQVTANEEININSFSKGIYMVEINAGNGLILKKIIKE